MGIEGNIRRIRFLDMYYAGDAVWFQEGVTLCLESFGCVLRGWWRAYGEHDGVACFGRFFDLGCLGG